MSWRSELSELLHISAPLVTESLLSALLTVIDAVCVGHILGAEYMAASVLGNLFCALINVLFQGAGNAIQEECDTAIASVDGDGSDESSTALPDPRALSLPACLAWALSATSHWSLDRALRSSAPHRHAPVVSGCSPPLGLFAQRGVIVLTIIACPVMVLLYFTAPLLTILLGTSALGLGGTAGVFCSSLIPGILPLAVCTALTIVLNTHKQLAEGESGKLGAHSSSGGVEKRVQSTTLLPTANGHAAVQSVDAPSVIPAATAAAAAAAAATAVHDDTAADSAAVVVVDQQLVSPPLMRSSSRGRYRLQQHGSDNRDTSITAAIDLDDVNDAGKDDVNCGTREMAERDSDHTSEASPAALLRSRVSSPVFVSAHINTAAAAAAASFQSTPHRALFVGSPPLHYQNSDYHQNGVHPARLPLPLLRSTSVSFGFPMHVTSNGTLIDINTSGDDTSVAAASAVSHAARLQSDSGPPLQSATQPPAVISGFDAFTERTRIPTVSLGDYGGTDEHTRLQSAATSLTWHVIGISLAANIVNVGLNGLLIEVDGFLGAPLATSLSRILQLVMLGGYLAIWRPFSTFRTWDGWQWNEACNWPALRRLIWRSCVCALSCACETWVFDVSSLILCSRAIHIAVASMTRGSSGGGESDGSTTIGGDDAVGFVVGVAPEAIAVIDAHCALMMLAWFLSMGAPIGLSNAASSRIPRLLSDAAAAAVRATRVLSDAGTTAVGTGSTGPRCEPSTEFRGGGGHHYSGASDSNSSSSSSVHSEDGGNGSGARAIDFEHATLLTPPFTASSSMPSNAAVAADVAAAAAAASHCVRVAVSASVAAGTLAAASMLLFRAHIGLIFTGDVTVHAVIARMVPYTALFIALDGAAISAAGALRGAGAERLVVLVNRVAWWGVGVPLAYVLSLPSADGGSSLLHAYTSAFLVLGSGSSRGGDTVIDAAVSASANSPRASDLQGLNTALQGVWLGMIVANALQAGVFLTLAFNVKWGMLAAAAATHRRQQG